MSTAYVIHSGNLLFSRQFDTIVNTFERGILKCQEQPFSACTFFSVENLSPVDNPGITRINIVSSVGTIDLKTQREADKLVPMQIAGSFTPDLSDRKCDFYFDALTSNFFINNINDFSIDLLFPPSDGEQMHAQNITVAQQLIFRRLMQTTMNRLITRVQQALMR